MDKITKDKITKLIADGRKDKALDLFIEWAEATHFDLLNDLLLLKSKLSSLNRDKAIRVISDSDARLEDARITNGILETLKNVDTSEDVPLSKNEPQVDLSAKAESNIILFLASNPWNTAKLQLEKEFTKVFNNLQNSQFVVKSEFAVTASSLHKAILKYKPRIIHFSGHGLSDNDVSTIQNINDRAIARAAQQGAGIVLQDEKGNAKVMETKNLVTMFQTFAKFKIPIDTVLFNSCHSKAQADGIRNYVNYVIGYSNAIKDDAAVLIAGEFYGYLAENDNVELAFELTKNIVDVEGYQEDELMELLKRDGL